MVRLLLISQSRHQLMPSDLIRCLMVVRVRVLIYLDLCVEFVLYTIANHT